MPKRIRGDALKYWFYLLSGSSSGGCIFRIGTQGQTYRAVKTLRKTTFSFSRKISWVKPLC